MNYIIFLERGTMMINSICNELSDIQRITPSMENEKSIREKLQILFLRLSFDEELKGEEKLKQVISQETHSILRQLQNNSFSSLSSINIVACDVWELVDELCIAADICFCNSSRRLIFVTEKTEFIYACCPDSLTIAVLNLISNAYLYSLGDLICVEVKEISSGLIIKVTSENKSDLARIKSCIEVSGTGLSAVNKISALHSGLFLVSSGENETTSAIFIPKKDTKNLPQETVKDFTDYLCDRCSILNTQLSII